MRRREFMAGTAALVLSKSAHAQMARRLLTLGGASHVDPSSHRTYVVIDESSFNFPGRPRANEPLRTQCIIRGLNGNSLDVGHRSAAGNNNYNGANDSYPVTLTQGQQWSENGATTNMVFGRAHVDTVNVRYGLYTEHNGATQSGTSVSGSIAPVPVPLPALNVIAYASATATPCGISKDRTTVYGTNGTTGLYQSTDDGATWQLVHTFPDNVLSIVETDDGEAFCITQAASSAPGKGNKSSGWSTSHSGATWTTTITSASGGFIQGIWGGAHFCTFGRNSINGTGKYGVIAEYGPQLNSATPDPTKPTHFYFSSDYGATWAQVLDLQARYPGLFPTHSHAAAYDPYWDRLWVTFGDTTFEGTTGASVLYSDDHGVTWVDLQLPTEWQNQSSVWQSTSIGVFKDCIILGSDNLAGFRRIPRKGYRVLGTPIEGASIALHTGAQMIAESIYKGDDSNIALFSNLSQSTDNPPMILISLDAGRTMTELWRDDSLKNSGFVNSMVLTRNGVVVANAASKVLRGTIVSSSNQYDMYANLTGDGATTTFSFAHGLSVTPTILNAAYPQNAAAVAIAAPTLSANGTNITLTFSVAPTNATAYSYALRYR